WTLASTCVVSRITTTTSRDRAQGVPEGGGGPNRGAIRAVLRRAANAWHQEDPSSRPVLPGAFVDHCVREDGHPRRHHLNDRHASADPARDPVAVEGEGGG